MSCHASCYEVICITEFSDYFHHISCKLFMCLLFLSTAPLSENLARILSCLFLLIPGNICLLKSTFYTDYGAILTDIGYLSSFQHILCCVFVDFSQIQCLRLSRHPKWILQQEVFDPEQFYVHIFQLSDSYSELHMYGLKFVVHIPRWFGHFTFLPLARSNTKYIINVSTNVHIMALLGVLFWEIQYTLWIAGFKGVIPTPLSKRLLYLASLDTEIGWDSSKPLIFLRFSKFSPRSCVFFYLTAQ